MTVCPPSHRGLDVIQILDEEGDVLLGAGGEGVLLGRVGEDDLVHVKGRDELLGLLEAGDAEVRHEEEDDLVGGDEVGDISHLQI